MLWMKLRSTAIAIGVGAATAAGLSLLKVDKPVVIGSTVVVTGVLMTSRKIEDFSKDIDFLSMIERGKAKKENGDLIGACVDWKVVSQEEYLEATT